MLKINKRNLWWCGWLIGSLWMVSGFAVGIVVLKVGILQKWQSMKTTVMGNIEHKVIQIRLHGLSVMFDAITKTWNPVIGCMHGCTYCWARRLAETRLTYMNKYKDGFKPSIADYELKKTFRKQYVFACDMGDLFGEWVPRGWILRVIDAIRNSPSSYFLFLTKNPKKYFEFLEAFPENLVLGATIETNREYKVSNAPSVAERYKCMVELLHPRKLVSVEPIMDFDFDDFVQWIKDIAPVMVHVGYTKFNEQLPEPSLAKTKKLMEELKSFTRVKELRLREKYKE